MLAKGLMKVVSKTSPEGEFLFSLIAPAGRLAEPRFGWLHGVALVLLAFAGATLMRVVLAQ
jgi:hypothetical protein